MDKVRKLLRQAWQEAKSNGVSLDSVNFNCEYTMYYGKLNPVLSHVEIDAKLLEQSYE